MKMLLGFVQKGSLGFVAEGKKRRGQSYFDERATHVIFIKSVTPRLLYEKILGEAMPTGCSFTIFSRGALHRMPLLNVSIAHIAMRS
jgi:hypothetical protein